MLVTIVCQSCTQTTILKNLGRAVSCHLARALTCRFLFSGHVRPESRVSSNLENLEMSGNFDGKRKIQGKVGEFSKNKQEKSGKGQRILLCEIHFQPV